MSDPTGVNETAGARNRLAGEKSPYLLQHADNPVDWYPWGEAAFERARREDKPVFLSIGYSTCHWCHVMAHESFEEPEVARLMNDAFVSIKVDREERPDIDAIYMTAAQLATGRGGWPLTVLLTPDKEPFFAATYIPREDRRGAVGMLGLIPRLKELWAGQRSAVLESAAELTTAIRQSYTITPGRPLDESILHLAYEELARQFDHRHGGFGGAPKFPTPHNLVFLIRHWKRTGEEQALDIAKATLRAMSLGGIHDHLGGGFHRYSTDAQWLLPHFEKMLYDQALLAMAYAEAYRETGSPEFADTNRDILDYVLRDMTSPEGAFYSAEDADSEGIEGKFYVWTQEEIRAALGSEDAELAIRVFGVLADGNFSDEASGEPAGANVLHLAKPLGELVAELSGDLGANEARIGQRLASIRQRLFDRRNQRVRPARDDKILADWNGLMIAALATCARVLDEDAYATAAERAVDFILKTMWTPDGVPLRRFRDGQAALAAQLDDYAFLTWGLIELFRTTGTRRHVELAIQLTEELLARFWDDENGGFFLTPHDGEALPARPKAAYDGALPSGNSVAMLSLIRLAELGQRPDFAEKAEATGRAFANEVRAAPSAHTQMLVAVELQAEAAESAAPRSART